jgi:hypothetical protein
MSAFLKLSTPLTSFYSPNTLGHATPHCSGSLILFGPSNVCTGELALLGLSLPANGNHGYISCLSDTFRAVSIKLTSEYVFRKLLPASNVQLRLKHLASKLIDQSLLVLSSAI